MTKNNIRDFLYEEPGPKTKMKIRVVTALALAVLAFLIYLVIRQFVQTGS